MDKDLSHIVRKMLRQETAENILNDLFYFADGHSYRLTVPEADGKTDDYILFDDIIKFIRAKQEHYLVVLEMDE